MQLLRPKRVLIRHAKPCRNSRVMSRMSRDPSKDQDQITYPRSPIGSFIGRIKKPRTLRYPQITQWKPWSDRTNAQAHPSLHRAPTQNAETAVRRLISVLSILLEYGHHSHCTHLVWRLLNVWSIGLASTVCLCAPPQILFPHRKG